MRKRIWTVWGVAVTLLLAGCSPAAANLQPVTTDFTCQASIQYREMELEATLVRRTDGGLEVAFSLPKSLAGITLGWDGTEMTMELGGVRMALPEEKVPESALVRCLLQVLAADHTDGTVTEDGVVFAGEADGKTYELVCHPDSGLPLSLSMPQEELTAVFKETKKGIE